MILRKLCNQAQIAAAEALEAARRLVGAPKRTMSGKPMDAAMLESRVLFSASPNLLGA